MGTSFSHGYFDRNLFGGKHGTDRQTTSPADSDTDDAPGTGDDGTVLTAKDIQISINAISADGITWISTTSPSTGWAGSTDEPEITVESTGIEVGEIIAWRAWRIKDGVLISLVKDTPWLPNETVEGFLKGIGEWGHPPGIYSFKKCSGAWQGVDYVLDGEIVVAGQVALWGEVVEHEEGYRAENARVHSLDFIRPETPENEAMLAKLQQRYGLA